MLSNAIVSPNSRLAPRTWNPPSGLLEGPLASSILGETSLLFSHLLKASQIRKNTPENFGSRKKNHFFQLCIYDPHFLFHLALSDLEYSSDILCACVVIWWLKPIKTFDTEYCAHCYCPWDTEKRARGYIALHHLYIMAQEGILWKYPLPQNTLQFLLHLLCTKYLAFCELSIQVGAAVHVLVYIKTDKLICFSNMKSFK